MSRVCVIAGYGPGISHSVALELGPGHTLALISRTPAKLQSAVDQFREKDIQAVAYTADLSDASAIVDTLKRIQKELGSIHLLLWNGGGFPKPLLEASPQDLQSNHAINVISLLQAVQTARLDLEKNGGAVLITGGGFGTDSPQINQYVVSLSAGTLGLNKASLHKLTGLLHEELKPKGVFVGEVIVNASVKGTAWDDGSATLEAHQVADAFKQLLTHRTSPFTHIP